MSTQRTARYPFWTPPPFTPVESNLRLVPRSLLFDLPRVESVPPRRTSFLDAIWRNAWFYNEPVGSWHRALRATVGAVFLPLFVVVALAPMLLIMIPLAFVVAPLVILTLIGVALSRRG